MARIGAWSVCRIIDALLNHILFRVIPPENCRVYVLAVVDP